VPERDDKIAQNSFTFGVGVSNQFRNRITSEMNQWVYITDEWRGLERMNDGSFNRERLCSKSLYPNHSLHESIMTQSLAASITRITNQLNILLEDAPSIHATNDTQINRWSPMTNQGGS